MRKLILLFIIFCISIASCSDSEKLFPTSTVHFEQNNNKFNQKLLTRNNGNDFNLLNSYISDDKLIISVEYTGGSQTHNFNIISDSSSSRFAVEHLNNNENSNYILNENIILDIKKQKIKDTETLKIYNSYKDQDIITSKKNNEVGGIAILFSTDSSKYANITNNKLKSNSFEINNYTVKSLVMNISVSHSGGCRSHKYELVWDGKVNDKTVNLYLMYDSNSDPCEAYLTNTISFDLNKIYSINTPISAINVINGSNKDKFITLQH
jgi:hypothetical protein